MPSRNKNHNWGGYRNACQRLKTASFHTEYFWNIHTLIKHIWNAFQIFFFVVRELGGDILWVALNFFMLIPQMKIQEELKLFHLYTISAVTHLSQKAHTCKTSGKSACHLQLQLKYLTKLSEYLMNVATLTTLLTLASYRMMMMMTMMMTMMMKATMINTIM